MALLPLTVFCGLGAARADAAPAACAPFASQPGRDYLAATFCAASLSFANRQVILHRARAVFAAAFRRSPEPLEIRTVYDVAHDTAKLEEHPVGGRKRTPQGHPEPPGEYRRTADVATLDV